MSILPLNINYEFNSMVFTQNVNMVIQLCTVHDLFRRVNHIIFNRSFSTMLLDLTRRKRSKFCSTSWKTMRLRVQSTRAYHFVTWEFCVCAFFLLTTSNSVNTTKITMLDTFNATENIRSQALARSLSITCGDICTSQKHLTTFWTWLRQKLTRKINTNALNSVSYYLYGLCMCVDFWFENCSAFNYKCNVHEDKCHQRKSTKISTIAMREQPYL